jgi:hypothetical protein
MAVAPRADFCIEIDFERRSENPSRVFRAMTEIIEAFQALDNDLVKSIHPEIAPVAIIEDVEASSLKAWLAYALRSADDDALKNLDWKKAVGSFLVKAKYVVLNFVEGRTEIKSRDEVAALQGKLLDLARATDVTQIPTYTPVAPQELLPDLVRIHDAVSYLGDKDKMVYIAPQDGEVSINPSFNIVPETLEELLTREAIVSTAEMILMVKKPDYLGQSQWDFRHGTHPVAAKILDASWLADFQSRKVDVRPGDSLRANVETVVRYGYDNEVVGVQHNITNVKAVLPGNPEQQYTLALADKNK